MPLEFISAEVAFEGRSKVSRYPSPERDGARYLPFPDVAHVPRFKISRSDKIMTIGSCFARNIERALRQLDLNVLSSYVPGMVGEDNIANKYTSKSILNDLGIALYDAPPSDEVLSRTIYLNDKGVARNLAFGGAGSVKGATYEQVLDSSRQFYANLAKIVEADVIIITFGLIETWYDNTNGVYLNIPPSVSEARRDKGRFTLHVLSYEDVRADISAIFSLINAKCKPGVQILSTVSPVPLHMTFRDQDCLQANTYSKSVQRAALEEVLCNVKNAHYFPSYEMVALAAPSVAWVDDDFRHVRPETVDRIMRKVISCYLDEAALPPEKELLRTLYADNKYEAVVSEVENYIKASGRLPNSLPVFMRYYYAAACLKTARIEIGTSLMRTVVAELPHHGNARRLLASAQSAPPGS